MPSPQISLRISGALSLAPFLAKILPHCPWLLRPLQNFSTTTHFWALCQQPIFGKYPFRNWAHKQFLDYLTAHTDASNIPFPELRIVRLINSEGDVNLKRFLRQWKELGIELRRLTVEQCYLLTTIYIELFENSVDEVGCGVDDSVSTYEGNLNSG